MTSTGAEDETGSSDTDTETAAEVEAGLAGVADLSEVPLPEHHRRLEQAHEVLHGVLTRSREQG